MPTSTRQRDTATANNGFPAPSIPSATTTRSRFRPTGRARARLVGGILVVLLGVLVSVGVYWRVNRKVAVLQLARDVPAGEQVTVDDLTQVRVSVDGPFAAIPAGESSSVVGQWAKTRLIAGSLLTRAAVQTSSLVAAGHAVVAVRIPVGELPAGLREQSRVQLVITGPAAASTIASAPGPASVEGSMVGVPSAPEAGGTSVSISVEVDAHDAAPVAAADRVRVVLIAPSGS